MDRRLFVASVVLTQAFLFHINSPARAEQPSAEEATLLESIIAQHEATIQKIESSPLFVEYSWRTTRTVGPGLAPNGEDLSGPMVTEGHARYWKDGTSYCEDRDQKNTWTETGKVTDGGNIFLRNESYAIEYRKNNPVLNFFPFDVQGNPPQTVKDQSELHPNPDILREAIRYSDRETLREAYEKERGKYSWTPSEVDVDGKRYYKITVEKPGADKKSMKREILFDPQCGYLIKESRTYNKAGVPFYVVQATFEPAGDGLWFPNKVTRNISEGHHVSDYQIEKISLGDAEIGKSLTLEALEIDRASILMIEHAKGGAKNKKGYLDGKWVPYDSLPQERKDVSDVRRKANAQRGHVQPVTGKASEP
jgi:hypothetical protein